MASPVQEESWTQPDAYIVAMARKRGFRRARAEKVRTHILTEYSESISNEEVAFLAVHIQRLSTR